MPTYSPPYRLYEVQYPKRRNQSRGRRRQFPDRGRASEVAETLARRLRRWARRKVTAESLQSISKYWYSTRVSGPRVARVSTKATTKPEAIRWVDAARARQVSGIAEPKAKTMSDALDLWLEEKRLGRRAEKTLIDYECMVGFWKKVLGSHEVSEVDGDDVLRYFSKRERGQLNTKKERKTKDESEPFRPGTRTLAKDRICMASFFKWARKRGYCTQNPVEDAPRWTLEEKEPQALTVAEASKLLDACRKPFKVQVVRAGKRAGKFEQEYLPPPHLYGVVLVALHTLLRLGSVLRLRWGDIDLERGLIRVPAASVKTRRDLEIPMTPTLRAYLSGLERGTPAAMLFGISLSSVRRSFGSAARRAGLAGLKFHALRKTGATILLEAKVPLKTVQRLGGWRRPDVLLKHYAAVTEGAQGEAVAALDKLGG